MALVYRLPGITPYTLSHLVNDGASYTGTYSRLPIQAHTHGAVYSQLVNDGATHLAIIPDANRQLIPHHIQRPKIGENGFFGRTLGDNVE